MMRVFLDDTRDTPKGWARAYTAQEAIGMCNTGKVQYLSLDHDLYLGPLKHSAGSGADVTRWIRDKFREGDLEVVPPAFRIHSAYLPGARWMAEHLAEIEWAREPLLEKRAVLGAHPGYPSMDAHKIIQLCRKNQLDELAIDLSHEKALHLTNVLRHMWKYSPYIIRFIVVPDDFYGPKVLVSDLRQGKAKAVGVWSSPSREYDWKKSPIEDDDDDYDEAYKAWLSQYADVDDDSKTTKTKTEKRPIFYDPAAIKQRIVSDMEKLMKGPNPKEIVKCPRCGDPATYLFNSMDEAIPCCRRCWYEAEMTACDAGTSRAGVELLKQSAPKVLNGLGDFGEVEAVGVVTACVANIAKMWRLRLVHSKVY